MIRWVALALALTAMTVSAEATEGTERNLQDALSKMKVAGLNVSSKNSALCVNENFCETFVGNIQIQAAGWTVKALVTSQEPLAKYIKVCAAMLAGLMNTDLRTSEAYVAQGFEDASRAGKATFDLGGVELDVSPGFDSRLECGFTSYRHRRKVRQ